MKLLYNILEEKIINMLGESKVMVLATASHNKVTARSISCVCTGLDIFFQTDSTFVKASQIKENSNVALCFNNIQIEGVAKILGHPLDNENSFFIDLYKRSYENSYKRYSNLQNEILVRVCPSLITLWEYQDGKPYRDYLAVSENRAFRELYDICV